MALTVSEVARLAGVTVRTLHHYDEIGLLEPSGRSEAGYRLYEDTDLETLQEILFFRELGFGLERIGVLMAEPGADRMRTLELQRDLLLDEAVRVDAMLAAVERALDATKEGATMDTDEMFEVFGDFDPAEYADEAAERWGDTDAYRESARRTARYTKADWARYKAEAEANGLRIAALMDEGVPADSAAAMDAAEEARLLIDTWFYPCSREMHAELGRLYVADPRFTKTYDRIRPGMAQYLCDAIAGNLAREAG